MSIQSNTNYYWEKDEVLEKLDVKMTSAFKAVSEMARITTYTCAMPPISSP